MILQQSEQTRIDIHNRLNDHFLCVKVKFRKWHTVKYFWSNHVRNTQKPREINLVLLNLIDQLIIVGLSQFKEIGLKFLSNVNWPTKISAVVYSLLCGIKAIKFSYNIDCHFWIKLILKKLYTSVRKLVRPTELLHSFKFVKKLILSGQIDMMVTVSV